MSIDARLRMSVALTMAIVLVGCGRPKNPIAGQVTYKGGPVADGYISFFPVGPEGVVVGAEIEQGRFEISDVPPGPRRVLVTNSPRFEIKPGGDRTKLKLLPTREISVAAPGNNQRIEITPGHKSLDIHIDDGKPPQR